MVVLLLAASSLQAATLTLAEYSAALTRVRGFIAAGEIDAARADAKAIAGSDVDSPNGRFSADGTLIAEINSAKARDLGVEERIDATLAALRIAAATKPVATDQPLLLRLQREQSLPELARGGDIDGVHSDAPLLERIGKAIRTVANWIGEKIGKFFEWLFRFWPEDNSKKTPATKGMRWTVGALVALILIVLGVLAFEVVRRSRKAAPRVVEESGPVASSRDDDPLSRGANEWERYAAQLAAVGRLREAIRAWYHAVLVTLYGANVLQFRKGRTNWEYIARLGPEIAWRPDLVNLTRRFEEEWYGSDHSSPEALDESRAAARRILEVVRRTKREAA
jgi:hypothetical protein